MKQLIFGFAILILWTTFNVFQVDNNKYVRYQEELKYHADECSNTAILNYDPIEYAQGNKVFDTLKANEKVKEILKLNLELDDNLQPLPNSYWQESIDYYTYFFDDTGIKKSYRNGILQEQSPFSFNFMFTEPVTGYSKLITEPTVVVTLDAGKPYYRLSFLNPSNVVRTSAYEYLSK